MSPNEFLLALLVTLCSLNFDEHKKKKHGIHSLFLHSLNQSLEENSCINAKIEAVKHLFAFFFLLRAEQCQWRCNIADVQSDCREPSFIWTSPRRMEKIFANKMEPDRGIWNKGLVVPSSDHL